MGTTYKMLGRYDKALFYFKAAGELFRKTKDARGLVYFKLGIGEVTMLQGRRTTAKKYIISAADYAKRYGFAVEKCHAETLLAGLSGKVPKACYNTLGLRLHFTEAPFNLP
jgi:tetratricopeptide (TPR) repeat protein